MTPVHVALVLLAVLMRLWFAWAYHGNFDQQSYEIVQEIVRAGGNVYAETDRYNYGPPWFLILASFAWLQDATGLPAHGVIRTFLTIVDLTVAAVLFRMAVRLGLDSHRASVVFLANPVTILVTGFHGPIDGLAMLFVWMAVLVQLERPRLPLTLALTFLAITVKPIVAAAPLYAWTVTIPSFGRRLMMLIGIGLLFALALTPWALDGWQGISQNVVAYAARGGSSPGEGPSLGGVLRMVALGAGGALAIRLPVDRAILLWALIIVATEPLATEQYYILPVMAGALRPGPGFWMFSLVATVALLGSPDNAVAWSAVEFLPEWAVAAAAVPWLLTILYREVGNLPTSPPRRRHYIHGASSANPAPAELASGEIAGARRP